MREQQNIIQINVIQSHHLRSFRHGVATSNKSESVAPHFEGHPNAVAGVDKTGKRTLDISAWDTLRKKLGESRESCASEADSISSTFVGATLQMRE